MKPSDPSLRPGRHLQNQEFPEGTQQILGPTSQPQRPKAWERSYVWVRIL